MAGPARTPLARAGLPSHEALVRRSKRSRGLLDEFAAQRPDDVLLWCHLPRLLWNVHALMTRPHAVPEPLAGTEVEEVRSRHLARRGRAAPGGIAARYGQDCLFVATNTNMRRAQAPLYEHFGPLAPPDVDVSPSPERTRGLIDQAVDLVGDLIAYARARELELPMDSASLCQLFTRAAKLLTGWERLLERRPPRVVVVGTQRHPRVRALLYVARRAGVPTVYVPHCPQLSASHHPWTDFTADYAGVRGEGEAALLAEGGLERDRVAVIGNPSLAVEAPAPIDAGARPVFAPSTERPEVLHPLIATIHEAVGDGVAVGRHPRHKRDDASAFPAGWEVYAGRTLELLRAGAPVLIQQSSGVALEALGLGVPVIELHFPGQEPNYPHVCEPHVSFASSPEQLSAALGAALREGRDGERRARLAEWAHHWGGPTSDEAAGRLIGLVEDAIAEGPRGPIWAPAG